MTLERRISKLEQAHADDGPTVFVCWGECDRCALAGDCRPDVVVGWDEDNPPNVENKKYIFPGDPGISTTYRR